MPGRRGDSRPPGTSSRILYVGRLQTAHGTRVIHRRGARLEAGRGHVARVISKRSLGRSSAFFAGASGSWGWWPRRARKTMAGLLSASLRNSRPNFVLFNVDDTGFGDWSWNLHGAAKHAASDDGGDDTPRTAALVRTPSGMHARPDLHTFRLCGRSHAAPVAVGRRWSPPARAPCHRTVPCSPRAHPAIATCHRSLTLTPRTGTPHRSLCSGRAACG